MLCWARFLITGDDCFTQVWQTDIFGFASFAPSNMVHDGNGSSGVGHL